MDVWQLAFLLIVAGICGGIAQSLVGYSRGGCLAAIALGFIGALLGTWIAARMGLPEIFVLEFENHSYPVVWSIAGAALFSGVLALLAGRRRD